MPNETKSTTDPFGCRVQFSPHVFLHIQIGLKHEMLKMRSPHRDKSSITLVRLP